MTELGLLRIDDRLIHGQVVAVWCRLRRFTRIVVVDDAVAEDSFLQEVMRLAVPTAIRLDVLTVAQSIEALRKETPDRETTMVLMKSPLTAERLFDGGVRYRALNLGALGRAPERENIYKSVALSEEEISILRRLQDQGVAITLLSVPGEAPRPISELVDTL